MVPVMFIARVYGRALCRLVNMVFRPKIALKVPSVIKSNPWGYENNEFLFLSFTVGKLILKLVANCESLCLKHIRDFAW